MTERRLAVVVMTLAISLSFSGCGGGGKEDDTSANRSPTAYAGVDRTIEAGGTVTLDGSGSSHPTGAIAAYRWAQTMGPAVSLVNDNRATASFVAPGGDTDTVLEFRLTVTGRSGATASDDVSVTVLPMAPVNQPPTTNAGPDQTVDAGSVVLLIGGVTDPDGRVVSVRWSQTAGITVSLSMQDQLLTSFVAPEVDVASTLLFRLTVTDGDGAATSDDASVTVQPVIPRQGPLLGTGRFDDPASLLQ